MYQSVSEAIKPLALCINPFLYVNCLVLMLMRSYKAFVFTCKMLDADADANAIKCLFFICKVVVADATAKANAIQCLIFTCKTFDADANADGKKTRLFNVNCLMLMLMRMQ